jgi:NADPH-dependent 2,4-dienoyl-CoA reductase/sulfur reductase-like enzyme
MRVVVIGGGVGGLHAAIAARAKGADVTVITDDTKGTYRRSGLPDIVAGYATLENITVPYGKETEGIEFVRGETATDVDIVSQAVSLKSGRRLGYDSLILATGSRASAPSIDGTDSPYVCTLKSAGDLPRLLDVKDSAIVVGAGFVALMTAEGYVKRRVKTTLMVRSRILRATVEPEIADVIEAKLREHGISVVKGVEPDRVVGNRVVTEAGEFEASKIVLATGITLNTELAKKAGLKVDKAGIVVDERMRTSVSNIYACGDCAAVVDGITGRNINIPLGSMAVKGAKVAGANAAGGSESIRFIRMQNEELLGLNINSIGYTLDAAQVFDPKARRIELNGAYVVVDSNDRVVGASWLFSEFYAHYGNILYDSVGKPLSYVEELFEHPELKIPELNREAKK